jgi:hypothetical protein
MRSSTGKELISLKDTGQWMGMASRKALGLRELSKDILRFVTRAGYDASCKDVAAGLLSADAFYQAGLDQRPEEVKGALFGDGERIPDFARREALVVVEQLEQLLLLQREQVAAGICFPGDARGMICPC